MAFREWLQFQDVLDARFAHLGLARNLKKIDAHAGRIEAQRLLDGLVDDTAVELAREFPAINVRNVGAQHERGLEPAGKFLQMTRLTHGQLDGVRTRRGNERDGLLDIFDSGEEFVFVEKSVINRDIEATARNGMKQAV
jgi:hypothetical protein